MKLSPEQLEWIVQEVLRRLGSNGKPTAERRGTTLTLSERVVTLEHLRGRLDGVQALRVAPGALLTPALRDELKDRQIQLIRE